MQRYQLLSSSAQHVTNLDFMTSYGCCYCQEAEAFCVIINNLMTSCNPEWRRARNFKEEIDDNQTNFLEN